MVALPVLSSFKNNFPDPEDHQKHRIEVKVDGLPSGEYAILASTNNDFGTKSNVLALQYLHVSDIAYVGNEEKYYVVNQEHWYGITRSGCTIMATAI